jgi:hypothetical protein
VGSRVRRRLLAVLAAVTGALVISGCVSVPNAGPVLSYPVNQETGSQSGQNMQFIATPPRNGWNPQEIVEGFLIAAAAFGNQAAVAREYLTPAESKLWKPSWNAYVYQTRPSVAAPQYQVAPSSPSAKGGKAGKGGKGGRSAKHGPTGATVEVNGKIQATLSNVDGTYAVPSGPGSDGASPGPFQLVNTGGQWRISSAPDELLLTPAQFADDYELRNLYFFDPNWRFLVPDPVYVPLQASASTLTSDLVSYLQKQPGDWLNGGATQTAFPLPSHLKVKASLAGNLATVNVTGKINKDQCSEVLSQLLWTLVGSGQSGSQVDAVELIVNGTPFGSAVNPVQNLLQAKYQPGPHAGSTFYYLGGAGELYSQAGVTGKPVPIAKVGTKFSQIAVSKDGKYLAALRNDALFIGPIRGPLVRQPGSYATLSWDPTDNLWAATAANAQIYVFRTGASPNSRQAQPILVTVTPGDEIPTGGQFTALQIAPDGVRVAMVIDSEDLTFGAIVWEPGTGPGLGSVKIVLSPFAVNDFTSLFNAVTWYGPDNVITLGGPGSTLTEYPVSGGTPTSQMLDQSVESITASGSGGALIAGLENDQMIEATSLTGAWTSIVAGPAGAQTTVRGNSPTYPG